MNELEKILYNLLLAELQSIGFFTEDKTQVDVQHLKKTYKIRNSYVMWMQWTLEVLAKQGLITYDKEAEAAYCQKKIDLKQARDEWNQGVKLYSQNADARALVQLTDLVMHSLTEIITGKELATNVMFPNGTMEYVEGIYKHNKIADYFNDVLVDALIQCIEAEIETQDKPAIRILEIGAGSGGTTAPVLEKLKPYKDYIGEYCYTDISKVFLDFGKETFGKHNSFMKFELFDVEKPVIVQDFQVGQYDFVIATNVLHATSNIKKTLEHAKGLLRKDGIIFVNEISSSTIFNHLTFGMLDGWWKYEDKENRIPGCPGLYPETWDRIFTECGYSQVLFPASDAHDLGQQIILAQSDGEVVLDNAFSNKDTKEEMPKSKQVVKKSSTKKIVQLDISEYVENYLTNLIAAVLGMDAQDVDIKYPFSEYGMDSIMGTTLIQKINEGLGISLQAIDLFDYTTVEQLREHIIEDFGDSITILEQDTDSLEDGPEIEDEPEEEQSKLEEPILIRNVESIKEHRLESDNIEKCDIAIIGYSGRFSEADSVEEFWQYLENGKDLVHTIERWDLSKEEVTKNVKTPLSNRAGLLNDIDKFDPLFFNISGREATYMDPQQRLFLEEAWKAMEDSGYCGEGVSGLSCGVYAACGGNDYMNLFDQKTPGQAFWGNMTSATAARLSYYLDLKGPAIAIDTACSSSMVAIHLACQGLWARETDMALAGGVALQCTPNLIVAEERVGMLSPDGKCYTFDERANGFAYGEGVAAVVLKRMDDALRDGDTIHGVIAGSGINQDGSTNGLTAPSAKAQEQLERKVYDTFGINPEQVQMVEAHGTGTKLGDPIEVQALTRAFRAYTDKKGYCAIGSVKTNVGHTQYVAGVAGVIKVLLSMKHKKIPASINFEKRNSNIDFDSSPFYVNTKTKDWTCQDGEKMQAVVSAFGASGTNAHMVLREAPQHRITTSKKDAYLFVVSAKTEKSLRKQVEQLVQYWKTTEETDSGNMSYVLLQGRKHFKFRCACVATDYVEARRKLEKWLSDESVDSVYSGEQKKMQKAVKEFGEKCIVNCTKGLQYEKNLDSIAELFAEGYALSYEKLFEGEKHQRISMPTYPFEKERFWIENETSTTVTVESKQEEAKSFDSVLKLYTEEWVEEEAQTKDLDKPETLVWMVSGQQNQEAVRRKIHENAPKTKVIFVQQKGCAGNIKDDVFEIDPSNENDFRTVFENIKKQYGKVSAISYMWIREDRTLARNYMVMFHLIQAVVKVGIQVEQIVYASEGEDDESLSLLDAAGGFGVSLAGVFPHMKIYSVLEDCRENRAKSDWATWTQRIWDEICCKEKKSVRYRDGKRFVATQKEKPLQSGTPLLREGGVYFVTGGAGKLLFELEKEIVKRYHASFVLLGRRDLDDRIEQNIKELEHLGGKAIYLQGDVSNKADVVRALKKTKKIYGNVNGYIHGAGVQGKRNILEKTEQDIENVLKPKIDGALVLQEVFQTENLDFRCYVSSSSAVLGDFGGCDYAIANRFLMSYGTIHNQNEDEETTLVVNWPMWEEGNMGFSDEAGKELYLKTSGLRELKTAEGINLWMKLLENRSTMQYTVMAGDQSRVERIAQNAGIIGTVTHQSVTKPKTVSVQTSNVMITKDIKLQVQKDLIKEAGNMLGVPVERIDTDSSFGDFGFDSISLAEYAEKLQNKYAITLSPAIFFSYSTFEKLTEYFMEQYKEELQAYYGGNDERNAVEVQEAVSEPVYKEERQESAPYKEPIAIIGMSGRFPGARDTNELWSILEREKSVVDYAPSDRFKGERDAIAKWKGGWIPGVAEFEPLFFEISPKEAEMMDPRHRLLLQESWRALEDAGYGKSKIQKEKIGMFVGAEGGDYRYVSGMNAPITSNHEAVLSARISYLLDMTGPTMTINTACSSSLVAAHQACQSLRAGECDAAIAAGVNLILSSKTLESIGNAGMISESGECFAFDKRADGMVPAEAVAVVVLKKLSQAEKDGDPIYAVIKGSGVNYDGKTNGITSPSGLSQKKLLKEVYEKYDINPENIGCVAAHGTGTKLGDPIEVNALNEAFRSFTQKENFCALISVKTNIGHSFAASGITSLIAMVKSIEHKEIPASLNFKNRNEFINWQNSSFYVNTETKPWDEEPGKPRTGAVSAFGMSGTNAHMVVEEYMGEKKAVSKQKPVLFVMSAKKEESLKKKIEEFRTYMETTTESLFDIAYTLLEGRHHFGYRCAFVAESKEEVLEQLNKLECGQLDNTVFKSQAQKKEDWDQILSESLQNVTDEKERLNVLAKYYCEGASLEWKQIEQDETAKAVHLNLYPFVKKTYWLQQTFAPETVQEQAVIKEEKQELKETTKQEVKPIKLSNTEDSIDNVKIVEELLVASLSDTLLIETNEIDVNMDFISLGLDSIVGVEWIQKINDSFGVDIKADIIYQYKTVHELAEYFCSQEQDVAESQQEPSQFDTNETDDIEETVGIVLGGSEPIVEQEEFETSSLIQLQGNELIEAITLEESKQEPVRLTDPENTIVSIEPEKPTEKEVVSVEPIKDWLKQQLMDMLALEEDEVNEDTNMADVGLDSILGVEWIQAINNEFKTTVTADKIYQYPTIKEMAQYIYDISGEGVQEDRTEEPSAKATEEATAEATEETESSKDIQRELERLVEQVVTAEINLDDAEQRYKKL